MTSEPSVVRTLMGANGFESSLVCLQSLVDYSFDPIRLIVHEDGSLSEPQRARLREIHPSVEVVDRVKADERLAEVLSRHPRCAAFRRTEILALKLFDILAYSEQWTAYCDSDMLFVGRYRDLFCAPPSGRAVFMEDVAHAYAVRPWTLRPLGSVRLLGKLNSGLMLVPTSWLDLDFLEWLLGVLQNNAVFGRRRYWTEQTCWAALSARAGGADFLDPHRVVMATRAMEHFTRKTVAVHFVKTHRGRLSEYLSRRRSPEESPIVIGTTPADSVGPLGMMWSDIQRRLSG